MKQSATERNKRRAESEVNKAWQSWDHLLYSKLVQFDHFLEAIQSDLASAGMPYHKSGEFLVGKIVEINERIQQEKSSKAI